MALCSWTNFKVHDSVICEKSYTGFDLLGQVINVGKKENWTETEPCGMPEETGTSSELIPLIATVCFNLSKKSLFHFRVSPLMPYWWRFRRSFLRVTLSNALLKSKRIRSVCLPICIFLANSSTSMISCVSRPSPAGCQRRLEPHLSLYH